MLKDIRQISQSFVKINDYESGIFWLEKACILSDYIDEDIYHYVLSLIKTQRHDCALSLLSKYDNGRIWSQYLSALCYAAVEKCSLALEILSFITITEDSLALILSIKDSINSQSEFIKPLELIGDLLYLKATLLEYSGHTESTSYYAHSLICNPLKYSCARKLFEDGLLSDHEAKCLIQKIQDFQFYYSDYQKEAIDVAVRLYSGMRDVESSIYNGDFKSSWDVRRWKAQNYLNCKYANKALELTSQIMSDSNNNDSLTSITHAVSLFQNLNISSLQLLNLEIPAGLSENFSSKAIFMFIAALRKIADGKSSESQQLIQKAVAFNWNGVIRMQPWCMSPSILWMTQGHASWNCGDNENALASFVSAADSTPGLVWPWFCIGVLHVRHAQYNLGLPYLLRSYKISHKNFIAVPPIIINEIACAFFQKKMYVEASRFLLKIISIKNNENSDCATLSQHIPIFCLNLAHCYLRLSELDLALEYAYRGLSLNLSSSPLIRLIGYIHDLKGQHESAQLMYHRSLFLSPQLLDLLPKDPSKNFDTVNLPPDASCRMYRQQDIFCTEMLKWSSQAQKSKNTKPVVTKQS